MGTPAAAVPTLGALAKEAEVDPVVTRPDSPRGRSRRLTPSPVAIAARHLGLRVIKPGTKAALAELLTAEPSPDVGVVVAFGMILPTEVLSWPLHGLLNVHFSLLPRWRGAAPVQRAIMAGDPVTGITIMKMDEGLDTGPIITQRSIDVAPDDTGGETTEKLANLGAGLTVGVVRDWVDGTITARPQPEEGATYASRLTPADRRVETSSGVIEARNRVRALAPQPGAQIWIDGQPHKLLEVRPAEAEVEPGEWSAPAGVPLLGLADGALEIVAIQPPGRRPMSGTAWLRGHPLPHDESA